MAETDATEISAGPIVRPEPAAQAGDENSPAPNTVDTQVDAFSGTPYEYDEVTGEVRDVAVVGRDSAGNAIYQSSSDAGGSEYQLSASGEVLPGVIDSTTWTAPDATNAYVNAWNETAAQDSAGAGDTTTTESSDGGGE